MEGGKGGAGYWPGFVDALTNVVIAMVFVIVVLAISLSFSAQLLAKRMAARVAAIEESGRGRQPAPPQAPPAPTPPEKVLDNPEPAPPLPVTRRIDVKGKEGPAVAGGRLLGSQGELVLEFAAEALSLDDAATAQLLSALGPLQQRMATAGAGTRYMLVASGPDLALSENQRSAYVRVMATRNLLLAQGVPPARIGMRLDLDAATTRPMVRVQLAEGAP